MLTPLMYDSSHQRIPSSAQHSQTPKLLPWPTDIAALGSTSNHLVETAVDVEQTQHYGAEGLAAGT